MPRSGDASPAARGADDLHSPLRGLLDYTQPLSYVGQGVGKVLNQGMDYAGQKAAAANSNDLLTRILAGIGLPTPDDITDQLTQLIAPFADYLNQLLNPSSPINGANIFNLFLSRISSSALTDAPINMLLNAAFNSSLAVEGNGEWSVDPTVYFPLAGQNPGAQGSTVVTADGTLHQLGSNIVTVGNSATDQLAPGQTVAFSIQALASGLIGTGMPVQMGVLTNLGITTLEQEMPVAAPAGWINPPAGSKAATLTGQYEIPDDGSVTWVRMLLAVTPGASAGNVRFSAASMEPTGGLLAQLQTDILAIPTAFQDFIEAGSDALNDYAANQDYQQLLTALNTAWITLWTTVTALEANAVVTLEQIVESVLGIDISSGLNAMWASVLTQITALQTLLTASPSPSPAQWAVWWSNLLLALGFAPPVAANIANFLSGNYDAAKQAKAWFDQMLASLGWTNGTQVASQIYSAAVTADSAQQQATLNATRAARKNQNDAIIYLDPLHTKYPLGSITDTAATRINNKPTWWGAVNDNLLLVAQQLGLAPETPSATADIGSAVTKNTAKAAQVASVFNGEVVTPIDIDVQKVKDYNTKITGSGPAGTVLPSAISDQLLPAQVAGPDGSDDIRTTISLLYKQLGAAMNGNVEGAGDLASLAQLMQALNGTAGDAATMAANASAQLAVRNNASVSQGWDDTSQSNMPVWVATESLTGAANSTIALVRVGKSGKIGGLTFITTGMMTQASTPVYINVWRVNFASGICPLLYASSDISSLWSGLNSQVIPVRHLIPGPSNFQISSGDLIAVEISGGTISGQKLYGCNNGLGMLLNTSANMSGLGATITRSAPASATGSIAVSALNFTNKAPFMSLEITNTPPGYYAPQKWTRSSVGTYTYIVPSYAMAGDLVDLIGVGGGGGGGFQNSGAPGSWNTRTLVVGTDINAGDSITVAVGRGGSHTTPAYDGDPTTFVKTSGGGLLLAAGGADYAHPQSYQQSPGNVDFPAVNPTRYFGGGNVGLKQAGAKPGGGGCWTNDINAGYNTPGAPGAAWIVTRQAT